jgi:molybdopterin/thiamine biosynthesis adenylyltransferase
VLIPTLASSERGEAAKDKDRTLVSPSPFWRRGAFFRSMSTNEESEARLARSRVLVVGVGGLGAPAAMVLAAAGVGTLVLVDPDRVELSNLHRQPLYESADIGRPKVDVAAARLGSRHPALHVEPHEARFTADHLPGTTVVLDGTDSIAAKFLVNDACVAAGVPLVHAGVLGFRVQLLTVLPGQSACYRCVFEEAPPPGDVPSCQEAGVVGPVPVLAGALQAAEAIRLATGAPAAYADRLLAGDVHAGRWRMVPVAARPSCPACASLHVIGRSEAS